MKHIPTKITAALGALLLLSACDSDRWCDTGEFWYGYDYRQFDESDPSRTTGRLPDARRNGSRVPVQPRQQPVPRDNDAYYTQPRPSPTVAPPRDPYYSQPTPVPFGSCDSEDLINFSCE